MEYCQNKLLAKLANNKLENKVMLSISGEVVNDQQLELLAVAEFVATILSGKHFSIFGMYSGKKLYSGNKMCLSGK